MIGIMVRLVAALVLSQSANRRVLTFLARPNKEDLAIMRQLMATGKVRPVIDRQYRLSEVPEAIRYLEQRHAHGKVVITFEWNHATN